MNEHEQLIEEFYAGFANGVADTMISCYHSDIVFKDPVFGTLHGEDVADMWRMLLKNGQDSVRIEFSNIQADAGRGSAYCIAEYTYKGREVRNEIQSAFTFKNGLIVSQTDTFDVWKWSRQALGWQGTALGWSLIMKNTIQRKAISSLRKYQLKQNKR